MRNFLSEHEPGCTPSSPCTSCQIGAFLRSKLSGQDYARLMGLLSGQSRVEMLTAIEPVPLDTPIKDLELSTRSYAALKYVGVQTVGELIEKSEADLWRLPNIGRISITNIKDALAKVGHQIAVSVLEKPLNELEWTVRTLNLLAGVETVEELTNKTARDLMSIHGFGRKSLEEVQGVLAAIGFKLADAPIR